MGKKNPTVTTNRITWSTARQILLTVASMVFDPANSACPASLFLQLSDEAQKVVPVQQSIDSSPLNPQHSVYCLQQELPPFVSCSSTIVVSSAGLLQAARCCPVLLHSVPAVPAAPAASSVQPAQWCCRACSTCLLLHQPRRTAAAPAAPCLLYQGSYSAQHLLYCIS